MNCSICKGDAGDKEVCQLCLEKVKALLSVQRSATHSARAKLRDELGYWKITSGDFVTIVDQRDAPTEEYAWDVASQDPLQPWYFVGQNLRDAFAGGTSVRYITHEQYCDWLRSTAKRG